MKPESTTLNFCEAPERRTVEAKTAKNGRSDANLLRRSAFSPSFDSWQRERAAILQRACRSLKWRHEHGENLRSAGKTVARRYDGMVFKCDPARKLQLSASTLRRLFRVWTRNGELPCAFRLNYLTRQSAFTFPILIRFIRFLVERPQPSLAVAWTKFCERGGNFGPGRRGGKPLKISLYQIRYALPTSVFREIRVQQKAINAAQNAIEQIRSRAESYARLNFPEHRRTRRQADFQI